MNSKAKTTTALVAASAMAAALSMTTSALSDGHESADAADEMEQCYGVAKAGANDCKSSVPGSTCQGSSVVDGDKKCMALLASRHLRKVGWW